MNALKIPFGATSTAKEVIAGVDLTGKRAIVTGASSGIGVETARSLAVAGAEVTLAVRDVDAGAKVAREIGTKRVPVAALDLSKQASIGASSLLGAAHCTSSSATPASWRRRSCAPPRAGRCSLRPTTWVTSRSRSGSTMC
jgi:hypothetical protein